MMIRMRQNRPKLPAIGAMRPKGDERRDRELDGKILIGPSGPRADVVVVVEVGVLHRAVGDGDDGNRHVDGERGPEQPAGEAAANQGRQRDVHVRAGGPRSRLFATAITSSGEIDFRHTLLPSHGDRR